MSGLGLAGRRTLVLFAGFVIRALIFFLMEVFLSLVVVVVAGVRVYLLALSTLLLFGARTIGLGLLRVPHPAVSVVDTLAEARAVDLVELLLVLRELLVRVDEIHQVLHGNVQGFEVAQRPAHDVFVSPTRWW